MLQILRDLLPVIHNYSRPYGLEYSATYWTLKDFSIFRWEGGLALRRYTIERKDRQA